MLERGMRLRFEEGLKLGLYYMSIKFNELSSILVYLFGARRKQEPRKSQHYIFVDIKNGTIL
jgi:hypothetical protein